MPMLETELLHYFLSFNFLPIQIKGYLFLRFLLHIQNIPKQLNSVYDYDDFY